MNAMKSAYDPTRSDAAHLAVLADVMRAVGKASVPKIAIFDLDSTLFDNRPRQVQIFREFGMTSGLPELYRLSEQHFLDWDLLAPMVRVGVQPDRARAVYPALREFWKERFFSSPYCLYDVAFPGAREYVHALHKTDATIVYLTGRHEVMRAGTHEALLRFGLPEPGTLRVHLLMKPAQDMNDATYKIEAHAEVKKLGPVICAFDNEPAHANGLKESFPDAHVVWVQSDHSTEAVAPRADLLKAHGFTSAP